MPAKFTNNDNLPESFVNAILVDDHVNLGDISVTQLIDAPQIRQLKRSHEYEIDIQDMIGMVFGTGIHAILERGDISSNIKARRLIQAAGVLAEFDDEKMNKAAAFLRKTAESKYGESINHDVIMEQTLTIEVDGYTISGTFDRLTQSIKLLEDYKSTSASAIMFPETKKSWNKQLNIYAYMLRKNGFEVESARIIAILKDWSKMKLATSKDYPKGQVMMHEVPLLDDDIVLDFIKKRISLHKRADEGEHIPCSKSERWAKGDSWAVKKKGGKRAIRVFPKESMAQGFIEQNSGKYKAGTVFVEFRPAESFRCSNGYCPVANVCPQYKAELQAKIDDAEDM